MDRLAGGLAALLLLLLPAAVQLIGMGLAFAAIGWPAWLPVVLMGVLFFLARSKLTAGLPMLVLRRMNPILWLVAFAGYGRALMG